MEENIILIVPEDCPEFSVFNLPKIGNGTIFERMQALLLVKTPTLAYFTEEEVQFLLDNRKYVDVPMYMVEHLPDYDFSPKWITFLTQFETVSFDALSQLITQYQKDQAEDQDAIQTPGMHVVPIINGGEMDEEDDEVNVIEPEIL